MKTLLLLPTGNNPSLEKKIEENLKKSFSLETPGEKLEISRFASGATKIKGSETFTVAGKTVVIIGNSIDPIDFRTLRDLISASNTHGAEEIILVMPYFECREDGSEWRFSPITASIDAHVLVLVAGGKLSVITMDLHSQQVRGFFPNCRVDHFFFARTLANYCKKKFQKVQLVATDKGAINIAKAYAKAMGLPEEDIIRLDKQRPAPNQVRYTTKDIHFTGDPLLMVDELTDTGNTLIGAAEELKELAEKQNIKIPSINTSCTHLLLSGDAALKLKNSPLDLIIGSDSCNLQGKKEILGEKLVIVSAADILSKRIEQIVLRKPVSPIWAI